MWNTEMVVMPFSLLFLLGKRTSALQWKQVKSSLWNRNRHHNYQPAKGKNVIVGNSDKLLSLGSFSSCLIIHSLFLWMHPKYWGSMPLSPVSCKQTPPLPFFNTQPLLLLKISGVLAHPEVFTQNKRSRWFWCLAVVASSSSHFFVWYADITQLFVLFLCFLK